jgi:hypothetical protein
MRATARRRLSHRDGLHDDTNPRREHAEAVAQWQSRALWLMWVALLALPCGIRATVRFEAAASAATPRRTLCGGCKVSKFERLLVSGSTELPECRCGSDMKIIKSDAMGSDGEVRTYRCYAFFFPRHAMLSTRSITGDKRHGCALRTPNF